ncbi:phage tail tape measure protein [Xanthomonas translucens]|uniref:phage tail tape measure protein n=1 Tax=Xanthomonas campestris pv. translucens TaxID=343 RepID=UPI0021B78940|nr:phage tail tape measure protein [Xanthomonas translucens]MCT8273366.1 phage tail tape measure protein [Xanthomonas translucens pv. translucens]MCT8277490.1 phage tail tape measure protein [Xanthomonas translucens pv. translucens]MCT8306317.1 phage tail tape measure protein [Xanthomonas translucens pv. translucens]WNJ27823.1 phage tail tape measure protein [Xanthomonas translucens pv. translucens]
MAASDNLRLQVILSAVDRVTGPFKKIMSGSKGVAGALRQQRDALRQLNAQQRDVGAYREQVALARQSRAALDSQRQAVRTLAQQIKATGVPTQKLSADFDKAVRVARELKEAHGQQEAALQRVRTRLEAAGIGTRDLVAHERRLRTEITATTAAMQASQQRLAKLDAAQRRAAKVRSAGMTAAAYGAGALVAGQGALRAEALPVGNAMEFESAMADVRKVVNFDTPQQFAQMGKDVENLSMRLPMLPTEIAKIVAAAGQAGVARGELVRFAEDATKMGVAFDSTAEESGQTMATWRTAFRMTQDQVVTLADKINYLGNTGPASVNKISDVVNRIGALGEVAGLQSGPLAALGATVAGMGIESEVSATGIKNMLLTLAAGDAATKMQRQSFKRLGIDAQQMAKHMQRDAGGAIVFVLEKLRQLPKAEQAAVMTRLFGRESIGAIAPLLTNLELLQTNFRKVGDAQIYGGSMAAEYASRVATSANALQLAKNTAVVLSQSIGATLLPDFNVLAQRVAGIVARMTEWIRANPQLVAALAQLVVGGTALVTVLGALLIAGGTAAMAFSQIHGAVMLLSGGQGLGALVSRFTSLGRLFPLLLNAGRVLLALLGGISLPVLAIGAAIAVVAALVWKYWGPIKAFMIGVWMGLQDAFAPVLAELRAALAPLAPVWDMVAAAMGKAWAWVKQLFEPFQATSEQLQGATDAGRGFGQVLGTVLLLNLRLTVKALGWLVQAFMFILPAIKMVLGGTLQFVQGAWSLIVGVFTGNGDRIRQGLLQLWSGVNTILAGWPARLLQTGVAMIDGLVAGIRSRLGAATGAIASVGSGVVDRFKGLLGIHSPSRVFAALGDYTMQGLTLGLQRAQAAPVAAVAAVGARMAAAGAGAALMASTGPALTVDTRPPLSAPARAAAAPAGGDHYEIHLHAAPGMDEKALIALLRRELASINREKAARQRSGLRDD